MPSRILLVGRTRIDVKKARSALDMPDLDLVSATSLAEVEQVLGRGPVSSVFMGAGIDLDQRLAIVRAVFEAGDETTIHLKDVASGPEGFLPFVGAILFGLRRPAS